MASRVGITGVQHKKVGSRLTENARPLNAPPPATRLAATARRTAWICTVSTRAIPVPSANANASSRPVRNYQLSRESRWVNANGSSTV